MVETIVKAGGPMRTRWETNRLRCPQAVRDQIAGLYEAGGSAATVAATLGVSRDVVYGEVCRRGLNRPVTMNRGLTRAERSQTVATALA